MNAFTNGLQVRVAAKTLEAIDICSFELVAVDGQGLPAFSAGSHVDVQVSEGVTRSQFSRTRIRVAARRRCTSACSLAMC